MRLVFCVIVIIDVTDATRRGTNVFSDVFLLVDFSCVYIIFYALLFKVTFDPKIRSRCVTLDGDSFDPAGTLTGGTMMFSEFRDLCSHATNPIKTTRKRAGMI